MHTFKLQAKSNKAVEKQFAKEELRRHTDDVHRFYIYIYI